MSWRWFLTRLTGLSLDSRWVGALRHDRDPKRVRELTDDEAEAYTAAHGV